MLFDRPPCERHNSSNLTTLYPNCPPLWTQPLLLTADASGARRGPSTAAARLLQVNKSCESRGGFQWILVGAGGYSTTRQVSPEEQTLTGSFLCCLQRCPSMIRPNRFRVSVAAFTATSNSPFPPHSDSAAV